VRYLSQLFIRCDPARWPLAVWAVVVKARHDVNVDVGYDLVCRYPVVLADVKAICLNRRNYRFAIKGTNE